VIAVCTRQCRLRQKAARGGEVRSRIRTMGILWRSLLLVVAVVLHMRVFPGVHLKAGWIAWVVETPDGVYPEEYLIFWVRLFDFFLSDFAVPSLSRSFAL